MKKIRLVIVFLILTFFIKLQIAYSDSPITSTPFYEAYMDNNMVQKANEKGVIDDEIAGYLLDRTVDLGTKSAVINALGWDFNGKNNALIFKTYLKEKYGKTIDSTNSLKLEGADMFCLGYLTVMDDYFNPIKAYYILNLAKNRLYESYTAAIIFSLIKAQIFSDNFDFCSSYLTTHSVELNKYLQKDMKEEAIDIIFDYMNGAENYCDSNYKKEYLNDRAKRDSISYELNQKLSKNLFLKVSEKNAVLISIDYANFDKIDSLVNSIKSNRILQDVMMKTFKKKFPDLIDSTIIATATERIENQPDYGWAYFERGKSYLNQGKKNDACNDFQKAIEYGILDAKKYLKDCKR